MNADGGNCITFCAKAVDNKLLLHFICASLWDAAKLSVTSWHCHVYVSGEHCHVYISEHFM